MPEYVALALTELVPEMQAQGSGSTYKEIVKTRFSQLRIPLPPLSEQKRLVRILDEKLGVIEKAKRAAEAQLEAAEALAGAYLREAIPSDSDDLPEGWEMVKLGDVCREDKTTIKPQECEHDRLPYMSLEHVESRTGLINKDTILNECTNVLSNTFAFGKKHVLYGKLRPYLNKVAVPDFGGKCTTEIIPLLPTRVSRGYLAQVLRRPETVEFAMKGKTGSRMPRTDMRAFMNLQFPIPSPSEQERVSAELDAKIKAVRKLTEKICDWRDVLNTMTGAVLRQAFTGEL